MTRKIRGAVVAKDPNTDEIIYCFESMFDAKKEGFDPSNICKCLNGKRTIHKDLKWEMKLPLPAKGS